MPNQVAGIAAKLRASRLVFCMAGIGIFVWAITVPYTKARFHLDDGTLGLMLLAGGSGGILAMPLGGMAMGRFGSRAVLVFSGTGLGLTLPLLSIAPGRAAFTALLFAYGIMFGATDIAMNAQGAVIERQSGQLRMSGFHACFSLGSLGIAVLSSFLLWLGGSNPECAWVSAGCILLLLTQARFLVPKAQDTLSSGPAIALPNRASLVLGLCCFACFMTEGAATDWSTIFLRFSRGMPLAGAALGYAAFAIAMAAARLGGDRAATMLGKTRLMRLGCVLAVGGFLLAILIKSGIAGIIGFGLVGLGTGNIAPLVFSAAGRVPGMAANHSVPAVVGLGYAGFLIGPVMIGLVANHFGLGFALGVDAFLLAWTFFLAGAVAR